MSHSLTHRRKEGQEGIWGKGKKGIKEEGKNGRKDIGKKGKRDDAEKGRIGIREHVNKKIEKKYWKKGRNHSNQCQREEESV